MPWESWLVAAVIGLILLALVRGWSTPDVIMLGGLTLLMTAGAFPNRLPDPAEIVAGFGNPGAVTVGVLYVVAAALTATGAMQLITAPMLGRPRSAAAAQARMMLPVTGLSAFLNNTPIVAMMIPVVNDWSRKIGVSPSKLLMPLSYAAIFGGMCTLIGTSTNLLIYGLLERDGLDMGMFTVGIVGLPVAVTGLAYCILAGRRLLPQRSAAISAEADPRQYTVEMIVETSGPLVGKSVEQAGLRQLPGLYLLEIERGEQIMPAVGPETTLLAEDRLVFAGIVESVVDLRKIRGLKAATNQVFKLDAPRGTRRLIEAVVSSTCPLVGKSIREGKFRSRYNAAVVAAARGGQRINRKIGDIVLRPGDTLLLETRASFVNQRRNSRDFYLVSAVDGSTPPRHELAPVALALLPAYGLVDALGWLGPLKAALLAAGLLWLTRCITAEAARDAIDWSVLLVIGASLGIGLAVRDSGLAEAIAGGVIGMVGSHPVLALLALFFVTNLFTEMITNNAAAVLMYPIAKSLAVDLNVAFMPFVIIVMIAASASFATPIGYQTNLMVYGPGGYRYGDYVRFGLPLNLIVMALAVLITATVWNLW